MQFDPVIMKAKDGIEYCGFQRTIGKRQQSAFTACPPKMCNLTGDAIFCSLWTVSDIAKQCRAIRVPSLVHLESKKITCTCSQNVCLFPSTPLTTVYHLIWLQNWPWGNGRGRGIDWVVRNRPGWYRSKNISRAYYIRWYCIQVHLLCLQFSGNILSHACFIWTILTKKLDGR